MGLRHPCKPSAGFGVQGLACVVVQLHLGCHLWGVAGLVPRVLGVV